MFIREKIPSLYSLRPPYSVLRTLITIAMRWGLDIAVPTTGSSPQLADLPPKRPVYVQSYVSQGPKTAGLRISVVWSELRCPPYADECSRSQMSSYCCTAGTHTAYGPHALLHIGCSLDDDCFRRWSDYRGQRGCCFVSQDYTQSPPGRENAVLNKRYTLLGVLCPFI